jgi:hypothetical protein
MSILNTGKRGVLCAGRFETGNANYWEVRREEIRGSRRWIVYRTANAVMQMGEFDTPEGAYDLFFEHVPNLGENFGGRSEED